MDSQDYLKDISDIKDLMNKSSRFISLSGISGILAGVYALIGAGLAHYLILNEEAENLYLVDLTIRIYAPILLSIAFFSIVTAIFLTTRKAKKHGSNIWDETSRRLVINFLIPLITGGIYILILFSQRYFEQIPALMLIFYGLALINASKYSIGNIRYLGLIEVLLGLVCAFFPGYGFYLWILGFGLMHIIYGTWMHIKFDKN